MNFNKANGYAYWKEGERDEVAGLLALLGIGGALIWLKTKRRCLKPNDVADDKKQGSA